MTEENVSPKKKPGRPPKDKTSETNSVQTPPISYEFNSFNEMIPHSQYYFGFNIFEYYKPDELAALVQDPILHNDVLRRISIMLYGMNGVYTNTVDYMAAMPTLDKVIVTHGGNKNKKKRNKELITSTLRTIKDKEIIRDALWRGMIEGIAFYYFETSGRPADLHKTLTDYDVHSIVEINELGINASIISLPADYTKIVGIRNNSYVIAFNLDYFDLADGEVAENKLKKYPKEIRDAYQKKNRLSNGDKGNWVILNNDNTIVHKIRSSRSERYGRPLVLAAINDILYGNYFTSTKRSVLDEINNRIIYQTFPEGKDKGTCALTKTQQENQHNTVKNAVLNKNNRGGTSFFSVAAGTKLDSIDVANTDIFDEKYEANLDDKIAMGMGIASSLLSGAGSGSYSAQTNNLELLSAQLFQWIEQIESELNKCISANIIKDSQNWVECRYLKTTYANRDVMVGFAKELYLQGKGSLSLWASACGISPDVFFALLDQEIDDNVEAYPVHMTSFTMSGKQDGAGRPTDNKSNNPNTLQSKSNNSNDMPKPSTK